MKRRRFLGLSAALGATAAAAACGVPSTSDPQRVGDAPSSGPTPAAPPRAAAGSDDATNPIELVQNYLKVTAWANINGDKSEELEPGADPGACLPGTADQRRLAARSTADRRPGPDPPVRPGRQPAGHSSRAVDVARQAQRRRRDRARSAAAADAEADIRRGRVRRRLPARRAAPNRAAAERRWAEPASTSSARSTSGTRATRPTRCSYPTCATCRARSPSPSGRPRSSAGCSAARPTGCSRPPRRCRPRSRSRRSPRSTSQDRLVVNLSSKAANLDKSALRQLAIQLRWSVNPVQGVALRIEGTPAELGDRRLRLVQPRGPQRRHRSSPSGTAWSTARSAASTRAAARRSSTARRTPTSSRRRSRWARTPSRSSAGRARTASSSGCGSAAGRGRLTATEPTYVRTQPGRRPDQPADRGCAGPSAQALVACDGKPVHRARCRPRPTPRTRSRSRAARPAAGRGARTDHRRIGVAGRAPDRAGRRRSRGRRAAGRRFAARRRTGLPHRQAPRCPARGRSAGATTPGWSSAGRRAGGVSTGLAEVGIDGVRHEWVPPSGEGGNLAVDQVSVHPSSPTRTPSGRIVDVRGRRGGLHRVQQYGLAAGRRRAVTVAVATGGQPAVPSAPFFLD